MPKPETDTPDVPVQVDPRVRFRNWLIRDAERDGIVLSEETANAIVDDIVSSLLEIRGILTKASVIQARAAGVEILAPLFYDENVSIFVQGARARLSQE